MSGRILVTGGNGYVGRTVVRGLYETDEVCVIDCLKGGQVRFDRAELPKFRFERTDIRDLAAVNEIVADFKPTKVIHLAAIHFIPECEADPQAAITTNVLGTVNMLIATPMGARFVYASSGAVYKPNRRPHRETTAKLEPADIYGFTKLHGENYVRSLAKKRDLSAVIVRLFNVIGPGETNPHLVPEIVAQLKAGHKTVRLGNLWPKRDYIHVEDAARGFIATALSNKVPAGESVTVNLGTAQQYSVATIVEKLRKVAGAEFELEQDDRRVRNVDRPFLCADRSEIQRRFGWEPQLTIDDALADLWRDPDLTAGLIAKYQ